MKTQDFLSKFRDEYKKKYGRDYLVSWQRDMAVAKRLMNACGESDAFKFIEAYFRLNSDFVRQAGHPLTLMSTVMPQIVASVAADEKARPSVNQDYLRIQAARQKLAGN